MELSSQNKKDIVYDDVTKTVPRAVRGTQFDFKNPLDIDEPLYALAMESTQVVADLLSWPDYDSTEIGTALSSSIIVADEITPPLPSTLLLFPSIPYHPLTLPPITHMHTYMYTQIPAHTVTYKCTYCFHLSQYKCKNNMT